jgi:long-chain fatty acid transport protein
MTNKRAFIHVSVTAAALVAGVTAAQAAGFELKDQSAVAQGTSYAGAGARADDPSTMYYNAAGITQLPGIQISTGLSAIMPQANVRSGSATTGALLGFTPYAGTTGNDAANNAIVPNIYGSAQITDQLWAGLAITSPFGLATKYPASSVARYYAVTTALQTINIGPTVAWKILPNWSIGGGLNVETADAHLSNAVDFGGIGALHGLGFLGLLPGTADGLATLKGNDTAVGWNLGTLYQPQPGTNLGLSYRSAMFHALSGTLSYQNVPLPLAAAFTNANATAKLPEPATGDLSIAQDLGRWTLLGDLTYTGWSVFRTLSVYTGSALANTTIEKFRDTLAISLGADYHWNDQLTLRAGTMYDPTPIQNADRTPNLPDGNRVWLSIGATYKPMPNLSLSAAYSHVFVNSSTVNLVDAGPGTANFLKGNLVASYGSSIDIISVEATYRF